jgi:hypothetical protein
MAITKYSSTDASAPQITNFTAGQLVSVLDACLVNGYGSKASAGWSIVYTGANLRVYRPPSGNRCYLRVDNSNASGYAVVQAYATMSDINTGTEPFTNSAAVNWCQSQDNAANPWEVIASDTSFYYVGSHATVVAHKAIFFFGDYVARNTAFVYNTALIHGVNGTYRDNMEYNYDLQTINTSGKYCRRGWNEILQTGQQFTYLTVGNSSYLGLHTALSVFPDPILGDMVIEPVNMVQNSSLIGKMPGLYDIIHSPSSAVSYPVTFSGSGSLSGRNLYCLPCYNSMCVIDLTGPWT